MEIKQIKKIGFFLGFSFVLFNSGPSLAVCKTAAYPNSIKCYCWGQDLENQYYTGEFYADSNDPLCSTCLNDQNAYCCQDGPNCKPNLSQSRGYKK